MNLVDRQLDVVLTCTRRDLPVFKRTVSGLEQFVPVQSIHVFVPSAAVKTFRSIFGSRVAVHDDSLVLSSMRYEDLSAHSHRVFPLMTGWYFQQFLKYSYAFENIEDDYYLIWDADTIPLRPLHFFDETGKMLCVPAEENNDPYFETYQNLLGEDAERIHSFISQHLIVQKSVLREMLSKMAERAGRSFDNWPWVIADGLMGEGNNLFSEYETYGNYLKNHYPQRMSWRDLPWLREGAYKYGVSPKREVLETLSKQYAYAAFESKRTKWRVLRRKGCGFFRKIISVCG